MSAHGFRIIDENLPNFAYPSTEKSNDLSVRGVIKSTKSVGDGSQQEVSMGESVDAERRNLQQIERPRPVNTLFGPAFVQQEEGHDSRNRLNCKSP